jgi:hypothetical protein
MPGKNDAARKAEAKRILASNPKLAQFVRELAPECANEEEFLEAFGFGNICSRCGRKGLDDEGYTDCALVPSDDGYGQLVCNECLRPEDHWPTPEEIREKKNRAARLRRLAKRQGLSMRKEGHQVPGHRTRTPENRDGYMLVESSGNRVVAGARFDLTLDDVEVWLRKAKDA